MNNIHYIGVNDRQKRKFEGLWPLPYGVSYNSYLITDQKNALIDTVDLCYFEQYLRKIKSLIGETGKIDYLIINHMEPDHGGSIRLIRQEYPEIRIVGNKKTLEFVAGYHGITDSVVEIKEGEQICLGEKHLSFTLTPMVHWPETMMTYCKEEKTLFSGDAFGCYGTLDGGQLDTEINTDHFFGEMRRYYSNIVGKYGSPVQKALQKLSGMEIEYICSTHGPIWHEQKDRVVALYDRLSRYEAEEGVVIAYGSMYGNTEQMAEAVARGVVSAGVRNVKLHNLSVSDLSFVLSDIFQYQGLIVGSPTYSNELFPEVKSLLSKIETRDIKNRTYSCFGSYSWAGTAVKHLTAFGEKMKFEIVGSAVENKQAPTNETLEQCFELGKTVGQALRKENTPLVIA